MGVFTNGCLVRTVREIGDGPCSDAIEKGAVGIFIETTRDGGAWGYDYKIYFPAINSFWYVRDEEVELIGNDKTQFEKR